jgi:hypothetical protein
MNKLKITLLALMFGVVTTPVLAGSADFAGPFIAVQGQSAGVQLDGAYKDNDGVTTEGKGGAVIALGSAEIGYNIPLGDMFFVTLGYGIQPGKTEISKHDDAADTADVKVKAEDFETYYIAPSIAVSETSALFIKLGQASADLNITGDFTGTASKDMDGDLYAIGTTTQFPSGVFVKAEAGLVEYDNIFVNDIGNAGGSGAKGDVQADPSVAYGGISIKLRYGSNARA